MLGERGGDDRGLHPPRLRHRRVGVGADEVVGSEWGAQHYHATRVGEVAPAPQRHVCGAFVGVERQVQRRVVRLERGDQAFEAVGVGGRQHHVVQVRKHAGAVVEELAEGGVSAQPARLRCLQTAKRDGRDGVALHYALHRCGAQAVDGDGVAVARRERGAHSLRPHLLQRRQHARAARRLVRLPSVQHRDGASRLQGVAHTLHHPLEPTCHTHRVLVGGEQARRHLLRARARHRAPRHARSQRRHDHRPVPVRPLRDGGQLDRPQDGPHRRVRARAGASREGAGVLDVGGYQLSLRGGVAAAHKRVEVATGQ